MKKLAMITTIMLATLALLFLLWQLQGVVSILLIAIVLAATLTGFSNILEQRGWSYRLATAVTILGALVVIVSFLVMTLYVLGERLPLALQDFRAMYGELRTSWLEGNRAQQSLAGRLPHPARLDDLLLGTDGSGLLALAAGLSTSLGPLVSNLVLVVFVALYWVADRTRLERLWLSLLTPTHRLSARHVLYRIEDAIGAHLRSQLVQSMLALVLLLVGYTALGLTYPVLLAWLAALVWLVPLIGGLLALLPALLIGLINGWVSALAAVLYTIVIFVVVRALIDRVAALRQQPGSILSLILAIALMDLLGIVGLLIAMPIAVAVQVLLTHWFSITATAPARAADLMPSSLPERLMAIQTRINAAEGEIAPRTRSLYERLQRLTEATTASEHHA